MAKLATTLREYIDAAFSALWVQTHEPDDAVAEIRRLALENSWQIVGLDAASGLLATTPENPEFDPLATLQAAMATATGETRLVILPYFAQYMRDNQTKAVFYRAIQNGKQSRTFYLVLSHAVEIPPNWRNCSSSWSTACRTAPTWRRSPVVSPPNRENCRRRTCRPSWTRPPD